MDEGAAEENPEEDWEANQWWAAVGEREAMGGWESIREAEDTTDG